MLLFIYTPIRGAGGNASPSLWCKGTSQKNFFSYFRHLTYFAVGFGGFHSDGSLLIVMPFFWQNFSIFSIKRLKSFVLNP